MRTMRRNSFNTVRFIKQWFALPSFLLLTLSACGGGAATDGSSSSTSSSSSVQTYSITGTNTSGATVSIAGTSITGQAASTANPINFTAKSGDTVTLTATKAGNSCTVAGLPIVVGTSNVSTADVTCTPNPADTFTIAVTNIQGASVTISGSSASNTSPQTSTSFNFSAKTSDSPSLAATKDGNSCTVTPSTISNIAANASATVSCTTNTYTVGGTNTDGASVSITNSSVTGQTATSANPYSFNAKYGDQVTLTATKTGYACSVAGSPITVGAANVTTANVTCSKNTYTIAVTNSSGAAVTITGSTATNTTNPNSATSFNFSAKHGDAVVLSATKAGNTCPVTTTPASINPITGNATATVNCTTNTYTVGGTNTDGASVTITNSSVTGQTATSATPYSFNAKYGDQVTLTATKTGYACSVAGSPITVGAANVTTANVTCSKNTYTISGTTDGTTVTASGSTVSNAVTTNAGSYSVSAKYGDVVTLTASKTGYSSCVIATSPITVNDNITANVSGCTLNTYTIAVTNSSAATVSISGSTATNATNPNSATSFNFSAKYNDNVSLSATKAGNTCPVTTTPASINPITGNATATVSCTTNTYTVGGTNTDGASVSITNSSVTGQTATSANPYSFNAKYGDQVTLTATKTGYACSVAGSPITVGAANVTTANVTCSKNTYTISGTTDGATLTATGSTLSNTITYNGTNNANYSLSAKYGDVVTLTATKTGYSGCTAGSPITVSGDTTANVSGCSATATTYKIGGTVTGLATGKTLTVVKVITPATASLVNTTAAVAFTPSTTNSPYQFDGGTTFGWSFNLANAKRLTHIGLYNLDINDTTTVGIWNSSGALVSSGLFDKSLTNVIQDDLPNSNFLWLAVNGLNLDAGQYTIGAFSSSPHFGVAYDAAPISSSGVQFSQSLVSFLNTASTPDTDIGITNGFFGPNMRFATGDEQLSISTNTTYSFPTGVNTGDAYQVIVGTHPVGQTCTLLNNTGTVATSDVTNVNVTCVLNTYAISGTNNTGATLTATGSHAASGNSITGTTNFSLNALYGDTIAITATKAGNSCSVSGLPSTVTSDVSAGVTVSCTPNTYTISGSVLGNTGPVTVTNGGISNTVSTTGGDFSFTVTYGIDWNVSVSTSPNTQICLASNNSGTAIAADVTNVLVTCTDKTYTVSGSITGYNSSGSSLLALELKDTTTSGTLQTLTNITNTNSAFNFTSAIAQGHNWSVTVVNQPTGQTCSLTANGSGTNITGNVSNVAVSCSNNIGTTYTVSGTVSGHTGTVTLTNNGANPQTVSIGGSNFTFTAQNAGSNYSVAATSASGQACSVSTNGTGSNISSNISNVVVTCLNANIILGTPTTNSIAMKIFTPDQSGNVSVSYGTSSGTTYSSSTSSTALVAGVPLTINLTSLNTDGQYYYRVNFTPTGGAISKTEEYQFHTARPTGSSFTFTMQADPHMDDKSEYALYTQTLLNVASDKPDFHIDLGDTFMTEKWYTYSVQSCTTVLLPGCPSLNYLQDPVQFESQTQARYKYELGNFGKMAKTVPLFLVNGNHDGELGWLTPLNTIPTWAYTARNQYFLTPVKSLPFYDGVDASIVATRLASYYSWRWGDALFIALDPFFYSQKTSKSASGWNMTLGNDQYQWLTTTLTNATAAGVKYKFIFMHNLVGGVPEINKTTGLPDTNLATGLPYVGGSMRGGAQAAKYFEWGGLDYDGTTNLFTSKRPGWSKTIHQLLVDNKVTAVFHGHDHLYYKEILDGVVYQEVPQPSAASTSNGATLAKEGGYLNGTVDSNSGYLRVSITPTGVTTEYVRTWLPTGTANTSNAAIVGGRQNKDISKTWTCTYQSTGVNAGWCQ